MKFNRRRGATLGLVAVCVLVIIVLGVGFFILSQILGGGREIANATDAGVLTVARHALSSDVSVPIPADGGNKFYSDFLGFDGNNSNNPAAASGRVDMLGINRVIAQAVIVALNAKDLDTPEAAENAKNVALAAKDIARDLRTLLDDNPFLRQQFTGVAQSNNTKMFQGNKANLDGAIRSGFLRPSLSTNVFFTPALLGAVGTTPPSNLTNNLGGALKNNNNPYMRGYDNFTITTATNTIQIAGVPVFPQQRPHLVDLGEFNGSAGADPVGSDYLPPNAFAANTNTLESNSGGFGAAVACAVVGALNQDFTASIPRGFMRFINGPDANTVNPPLAAPVVDGTNDVFNNELWAPNGGINVASNGVFSLNRSGSAGTGNGVMSNWIAYNVADLQDDGVQNDSITTPPRPPLPSENPGLYRGNPPNNPNGIYVGVFPNDWRIPTNAEMRALRGVTNCDTTNYHAQSNACYSNDPGSGDAVNRGGVGDTYGALSALTGANNAGGSPPSNGFTAVEYQKVQLLQKRARGAECATVTRPQPSGMKFFNPNRCYAVSNPADANFGTVESPLQYLNQIGSVGNSGGCHTSIINKVVSRIKQADPSLTNGQIIGALGSRDLPLGGTLYLYSPGPGQIELAPGSGSAYFQQSITNDGTNVDPARNLKVNCASTYRIDQTIVNSTKGRPGCGSVGDMNYHLAPFTENDPLRAHDRAIFTPASGWRNLLGDVQFVNEAEDAGTFCKPN